ncbi:hypothetical protein L1049_008442 [Liquidambar formosana]|uniref:BZIP domain-containing protein n=1 Tax=Liquidambar formosana TaxID=63359 RepID=A0AAP0X958_LIQFO
MSSRDLARHVAAPGNLWATPALLSLPQPSLPSFEVLSDFLPFSSPSLSLTLFNMDTEAYSGSSSFSSYASSSPPSAAAEPSEVSSAGFSRQGSDRMVRIELEAAEALADLAHSAIRESSESGGKWGNKGKRARNRVKNESPPVDSVKNSDNSVPRSSDLSQDPKLVNHQQCKKICRNVMMKTVKAEQDAELPKPSPMCSTSYMPFGGGRSRQNLTEAEKEARRLRRVLANRESARQTIRRRQALCEELTRKAADLVWENESLEREKDLALKEYQSLKSTNEHLKAQMARTIKVEAEETPVELESAHVKISTSPSTNCPLLLYNYAPCTPFIWPSIIQSSNPVQSQHGAQNAIVVSPKIPMPPTGNFDSSHEQENHLNTNVPRTPLYVLPCPWFFPHPENGKGFHSQPSFRQKDKQNEISVNNQHSASSSSKTIAHIENHQSPLPIKVKIEASTSTEAKPTNGLNEIPFGFPLDRGAPQAHPKVTILRPTPLSSTRPAFNVKHENGLQPDCTPDVEAVSSNASYTVSPLPEKNQEPVIYPTKKLVDAVAAAEARKRRKELTKLKNLHGRQCQLHC